MKRSQYLKNGRKRETRSDIKEQVKSDHTFDEAIKDKGNHSDDKNRIFVRALFI